jgi:glycosyltransferase involved in cell wall biosynthesis
MTPTILYTTSAASPQSGAYRQLLEMAHGIEAHGFQTALLLPKEQEESPLQLEHKHACSNDQYMFELPLLRASQTPLFYADYLRKNALTIHHMVRLLKKNHIDIVHVNEIFDIYAAVAARIARKKCVWHIRAELTPWPILKKSLPRLVTSLADTVLVVSQSVRENLFPHVSPNTGNVHVLYDPAPEPHQFNPNITGQSVREEFKIRCDQPVVTLVAKLISRKGHDLLLRAAPEVLKAHPDTIFLLVGGERSGSHHKEYANRLRSLVASLNLQKQVFFTGFRSDIPEIMAASDIIVHCSTYPDPFPGVVLQGMASGKPVVAPALGGPKEQIEDRVSGILVQPNNPYELANAIAYLLQNETERSRIGKAAVRRARSNFSSEKFFTDLLKVYSRLTVNGQP